VSGSGKHSSGSESQAAGNGAGTEKSANLQPVLFFGLRRLSKMDDKNIMENILLTTKGVCDLYLHGTIESSTQNVQSAFSTALNDSLCIKNTVYTQMSAKGWYPSEQATQQQIQQVKQKYSAQG